MKKPIKYSPEVRERAVRMVLDHQNNYPSEWAAIESIAAKIALHTWLRQHQRNTGLIAGPTTAEQQRVKELRRGLC